MYKRKSLAFKLLLTFFTLAVIATTLATGTLASFSATYTWQSNQGTIGAFDYEDTSLSINLFDENPIYPANSGSAMLTGANFGDSTLSWGFAETNASNLPILFYVDNGTDLCGFYSSYDFATAFPALYLNLDASNYIACSQVSTLSSTLASNFAIGFSICWIWPDILFSYADSIYSEVLDNPSVNNFKTNNENLCKSIVNYNYDNPQVLPQLTSTQAKFNHIATATITDGYSISALVGSSVSVSNGLLMSDLSYLKLFSAASANFITPTADYVLASGDYYLLLSSTLSVSTLKTNLAASGLNCQIVGNIGADDFTAYYKNAESTEISINNSGTAAKPAVKIFPSMSTSSPTISVVITAEVSI